MSVVDASNENELHAGGTIVTSLPVRRLPLCGIRCCVCLRKFCRRAQVKCTTTPERTRLDCSRQQFCINRFPFLSMQELSESGISPGWRLHQNGARRCCRSGGVCADSGRCRCRFVPSAIARECNPRSAAAALAQPARCLRGSASHQTASVPGPRLPPPFPCSRGCHREAHRGCLCAPRASP